MELAMKLLMVAGLGAIELWAAIPAGLALQLHPLMVGAAAASGAMLSALAVISLAEGVRIRLIGRRGSRSLKGRHGLIHRTWQRYGVIGLGLLAPLLTGAPLGAALGLALGAPVRSLLLWVALGVVVWSAGLTAAGALGLAGIESLGH